MACLSASAHPQGNEAISSLAVYPSRYGRSFYPGPVEDVGIRREEATPARDNGRPLRRRVDEALARSA